MNAASQRWSVLASSSKSISTLLAWQLTSSLQFPALFCLVVVQILLPALFLCLLHKTTETEYRSQHLVNQLTQKKRRIVQPSSAGDQGIMNLQEVKSKALAMRTILTAEKAEICLLFCCIHLRGEEERLVCHKSKDCRRARQHYILCLATFTKRMGPQSPNTRSSTQYHIFSSYMTL